MISQIKQKGFTIVELLIVIVVIAILAALSYVGYTSITARANNSTAAASAKAVKDTAQVFFSTHGSWPTTKAHFNNGIPTGGNAADAVAKLPSDVKFAATSTVTYANRDSATQALSGTDAPKTVHVYACGTAGYRIFYKDFTAGVTTAKSMDVGDCTTTPTGNALAN